MAGQYQWITLDQAVAALQGRLQNPDYWTVAELKLYLQDSVRLWNAITETWRKNYIWTPVPEIINGFGGGGFGGGGFGGAIDPSTVNLWSDLGTLSDSPRFRTVTDADLYTRMQYMLLENPTGAGTWTGTNQFTLAAMQYALDKRRNEVIQVAACNMATTILPSTPGTRTAALADTTLEPVRVRFIPTLGYGDPIWLSREDLQSFSYWEPNYNQTSAVPSAWDVITQPVLSIFVDTAPAVPGTYEVISIQSGPALAPPASSLLGVPDDWSFLPMFGALADLLDSEPTRTDRMRAKYCSDRYQQGLKAILQSNWMLNASGEQATSDITSLSRADQYMTGWDSPDYANGFSEVVVAGMDYIAAPFDLSVNLSLVANMPFPSTGSGFIQIPRDAMASVLDYAQHLALFKQGGEYFEATIPLFQNFIREAMATKSRVSNLGLYADVLRDQGRAQELDVAR